MDTQENKEAKVSIINKGARTIIYQDGEIKPGKVIEIEKSKAEKLIALFDGEIEKVFDHAKADELKKENESLRAENEELKKSSKKEKKEKKEKKDNKPEPVDNQEPEMLDDSDEVPV
jgi:regulator of replication initiation timing